MCSSSLISLLDPITALIKHKDILNYQEIIWKEEKRCRRLRQLSLGNKH